MTKRISTLLAAFLIVAVTSSHAALPEPAKAEILSLLGALQNSGCEFNRNGTWYSGADARAHLQKKLDYLDGKNMVNSTEQFVELGASTSSMSGKPYLVRCAGNAPVESASSLTAELKQLRAARAASSLR